jgi:iron complex transport system substrate-binding protein
VKRANAIFVVGLLLLAAGCRSSVQSNASTAQKRQVTDDLGRTVTIPAQIKRVVSLAPNLTENIFAIGAGDRLVGVTTFCNYPEQAKSIAKIGDTMNPNIETIVALKPDVVFVSTASQIEAFMKTLEQNGIAVYVSDPKSLETLYHGLVQLGYIFDLSDNAQSLVSQLKQRESNVRSICKRDERDRVRVFVQISKEPLFTIGKGALLNDVVHTAGGRSVTESVESAYPKLSKETALSLDPEVIVLSESEDNLEPNEVFGASQAVRNGRVYKINADLLSRPGPRLVDVLEMMADYLGCSGHKRDG